MRYIDYLNCLAGIWIIYKVWSHILFLAKDMWIDKIGLIYIWGITSFFISWGHESFKWYVLIFSLIIISFIIFIRTFFNDSKNYLSQLNNSLTTIDKLKAVHVSSLYYQ